MSDQNESGDIRITGDELRASIAATASFKLGRHVLVAEVEGLALIDNAGSSFGFIAEDADQYEIDIIMFDQAKVAPEAAVVTAEIGPEDLVYSNLEGVSTERELPEVADAGLTAGQYNQFLGLTTFAGIDADQLMKANLRHTGMTTGELVDDMARVAEEMGGITAEVAPPWVELDSEEPTRRTLEQYVEASAAGIPDDEIAEAVADVPVEDGAVQVRREAAKRGWETRRKNQAAKEEVVHADVPAEAVAVVANVEDIKDQVRALALTMGDGPSEYEEHVKAESLTPQADAMRAKNTERADSMRALLARLQK